MGHKHGNSDVASTREAHPPAERRICPRGSSPWRARPAASPPCCSGAMSPSLRAKPPPATTISREEGRERGMAMSGRGKSQISLLDTSPPRLGYYRALETHILNERNGTEWE